MEFQGKSLHCQMLEDGIVEMTFDLHDESVNKFNRLTMAEFREVVQRLGEAASLKGLLINSAKEAFISSFKNVRMLDDHAIFVVRFNIVEGEAFHSTSG